jgi:intracellular septation protein A
VVFLVLETEPEISLPDDIWVKINIGVSSYFLTEYIFRVVAYNSFEETFKEFASSKPNKLN